MRLIRLTSILLMLVLAGSTVAFGQMRDTASFASRLENLRLNTDSSASLVVAQSALASLKYLRRPGSLQSISVDPSIGAELNAVNAAIDNTDQKRANLIANMVADISTGTSTVFTGAGLAQLQIQIQQRESSWDSEVVRTGFDKVRPYFDIAGGLLLGAATYLASDNQDGKPYALGGGVVLTLGPLLSKLTGGNKAVQRAAGEVDGVQVGIAQLSFSRAVYDELQARMARAEHYYAEATALTTPLSDLRTRARAVQNDQAKYTNPDTMIVLIDSIMVVDARYNQIARFVDEYTGMLLSSLQNYSSNPSYTPIKPKIDSLMSDIRTFRTSFEANIERKFLNDLPRFRIELAAARAVLAKRE